MSEEIWKPIKGFENLYEVSSLGRVKRLSTQYVSKRSGKLISQSERILKPVGSSYVHVTLCKDGIHKDKAVHRLVAETFVDNPHHFPQVNHKDCNKQNNKADNLEWVTARQNTYHAYKNNLNPVPKIELKATNLETGKSCIFESVKAFEESTNSKNASDHLYRGTSCNGYRLEFADKEKRDEQLLKLNKIHHQGSNIPVSVKCIETGQVFDSIRKCGKYFGCDDELIRVSVRYRNGYVKKINLTFQEV